MNNEILKATFSEETLERLFPPRKTRDFFEALFGDDSEGAFDIKLRYGGLDEQASRLRFYLDLHERPGCCLVCSLTHGLPEVFSRHPVINLKGLVAEIEEHLGGAAKCAQWQLDSTSQVEKSLHSVPLTIFLEAA